MNYDFEDKGARAGQLKQIRRVVVKLGTRLLLDVEGSTMEERIALLVGEIARLRESGLEVIVVTSGAIGTALRLRDEKKRPKQMAHLQAYAALGQSHLMTAYEEACQALGFHSGQLLLTAADLHDRERHVKVAQCVEALLELGVLPVINENDSVSVDEIKVGDNDTLAALVASMSRADLTILLTTIDGLRERDSATGRLGRRISVVHELSEVLAMAGGTDGNRFSVGGMVTKLRAAAMTTMAGDPLWIADGTDFSVLRQIFAGEDVGTIFLPERKGKLHAKQRFLAFFSDPEGELVVDAGAENALRLRGTSLLPSGILGLRGTFAAGATVRIVNTKREELARGTVQFNHADLSKICGAGSTELAGLLGYQPAVTEAVHRNSLVLTCNF
ncbi:MAG: glutamate 5-kinase [Victivallales bacterium]|nr:glutamate 5-kinase [Victivallales bacterium]